MILADPQNAAKAVSQGKKVLLWTEDKKRGDEKKREERESSEIDSTNKQGGDEPDSCVLLCYC